MFYCFINQKNIEKKPFATMKLSSSSYTDVDIIEEKIKNIRMIFSGYIDILILLKFIAIIILFFECIAIFLAIQEFVMYIFIIFSISSFLLFCAIITAIQEENRKYIFTIMIWFYFKILLIISFLGIVTLSTFTNEFIPYVHHYFAQDSKYVIMISLIVVFLTILQIFLTTKAHRYFGLRDELYTIPSVKVQQIRPELAHVLTRNKV